MVSGTPSAGLLNLEDADYANEELSHAVCDLPMYFMQTGNGGIFRAIAIPLPVFGTNYKGAVAETQRESGAGIQTPLIPLLDINIAKSKKGRNQDWKFHSRFLDHILPQNQQMVTCVVHQFIPSRLVPCRVSCVFSGLKVFVSWEC